MTPAESEYFGVSSAPSFELMSLLNSTADVIIGAVGRFKALTPLSSPEAVVVAVSSYASALHSADQIIPVLEHLATQISTIDGKYGITDWKNPTLDVIRNKWLLDQILNTHYSGTQLVSGMYTTAGGTAISIEVTESHILVPPQQPPLHINHKNPPAPYDPLDSNQQLLPIGNNAFAEMNGRSFVALWEYSTRATRATRASLLTGKECFDANSGGLLLSSTPRVGSSFGIDLTFKVKTDGYLIARSSSDGARHFGIYLRPDTNGVYFYYKTSGITAQEKVHWDGLKLTDDIEHKLVLDVVTAANDSATATLTVDNVSKGTKALAGPVLDCGTESNECITHIGQRQPTGTDAATAWVITGCVSSAVLRFGDSN